MSDAEGTKARLEIAHVLFIDIVGYSKLLTNEQSERLRVLREVIGATAQIRLAQEEGMLMRLPTGDGVALVFRSSPEAPVLCAMEISEALKTHPELKVRMGLHSGPVNEVTDLDEKANIAGVGINLAQRVMDCGDAGHILLSKRIAEDLAQDSRWRPQMHELGVCRVKHGVELSLVNFFTDKVGNPDLPAKVRQTRRDERKARRRIIFAVGALAVIGLAAVLAYKHWHQGEAPTEKSIAVLPLENLSEEKENAFFADGIQDELLSNLAKIKDLKVISRTSVMQYKTNVTRNLKEIARQLGVGSVVEGSVRRSGNHIRVIVQLIDAQTDRHIWAQTYDRELADSLALQGELATEIAKGLGATLSPQEKARVAATPTKNTAAYDAYLRGRVFIAGAGVHADRSNVDGAIRSYEEAVKLDPGFALAWVYLSCAQSFRYWIFDPSTTRLAAAKEAADRALALDPNLPEVHLALGYYRYYGLRDFGGALTEFQQAEQGLPNNVDVLGALALIQRRLGHWEETLATLRAVVALDPRNTEAPIKLAFAYGNMRRFPEALASVDRLLDFEPTNKAALGMKASILWAMGDLKAVEPLLANPGTEPVIRGVQALLQRRYPEAIEIFSKALAETPVEEQGGLFFMLALTQQRAGNAAAARAISQKASQDILRALEAIPADSAAEADLREHLSRAYAGLGEAESAIAEGQKAMALDPTSKDPFEGWGREVAMAQVYALLGDANHAIPIIRRLLEMPTGMDITPAFLRLEPIWDPIRHDRRFQELAADKAP